MNTRVTVINTNMKYIILLS